MILLALGGNLPHPRFGGPRYTLEAALTALTRRGVRIVRRSGWYETAPVPDDGQPWYVNGVAVLETELGPAELLELLLAVEAEFGRVRTARNAPRMVDLDLLAYHDHSTWSEAAPATTLELPHPRLHERAFVLLPLAEIAPEWRHPVLGRSVREMIEALPPGQRVQPGGEDEGPSVAGRRPVR